MISGYIQASGGLRSNFMVVAHAFCTRQMTCSVSEGHRLPVGCSEDSDEDGEGSWKPSQVTTCSLSCPHVQRVV